MTVTMPKRVHATAAFRAAAMAALMIVLTAAPGSAAEATGAGGANDRDPTGRLMNNTLYYNSPKTGIENWIHLGRFGNFDRYFPCEFTDGTWNITAAGELCINHRVGGEPSACYRPEFSPGKVRLTPPPGNKVILAKLIEGNKIPFG